MNILEMSQRCEYWLPHKFSVQYLRYEKKKKIWWYVAVFRRILTRGKEDVWDRHTGDYSSGMLYPVWIGADMSGFAYTFVKPLSCLAMEYCNTFHAEVLSADDSVTNFPQISKKFQNYCILLLYLEWSWEIHSNKYKHALDRC